MATTTTQIAASLGLSEQELIQEALVTLILERKRQVLQLRLDILSRYNVISYEELESKIAENVVPEHPAWEDCIVAENLTARLEELDAYLDDLQQPTANRTT